VAIFLSGGLKGFVRLFFSPMVFSFRAPFPHSSRPPPPIRRVCIPSCTRNYLDVPFSPQRPPSLPLSDPFRVRPNSVPGSTHFFPPIAFFFPLFRNPCCLQKFFSFSVWFRWFFFFFCTFFCARPFIVPVPVIYA